MLMKDSAGARDQVVTCMQKVVSTAAAKYLELSSIPYEFIT